MGKRNPPGRGRQEPPPEPEERREETAPGVSRFERAFALYCQGMRTQAIAEELGVSAATVRRWRADYLRSLAADARAEQASQLVRSIESQRAIASAAWEAYERERTEGDASRHSGHGARYLSVALAAQREVARLQGLYERISREPPPVHITITRRPEGPENRPPEPTASADA
jgi:predicted transcriptional regulator